jgi:hypothetical protein
MGVILLFKSVQMGLFDAPVNVRASVRRDGTVVKPHTRVQKVRPKEIERDLFGPAPPKDSGQPPEELRQSPSGLELRHKHGESWALIGPDPSSEGKWRYQIFDRSGPQAHLAFDSAREALEGAWAAGYREKDAGAIDRIMQQNQKPRRDERITVAAERLRGRAEGIIARAEQELGRERLANTHRRARMAANAMGHAESQKAFGNTLLKVADAMEAGTVRRLQNLKNGAQLEQLESCLRRAKREVESGMPYHEAKAREGKSPSQEDAAAAVLPALRVYTENLDRYVIELQAKGRDDLVQRLKSERDEALGPDVKVTSVTGDYSRERADTKFGISPGLAAELVEAIPGGSFVWHLRDALAERKRLAGMGILSDEDLRETLAELLDLRSERAGLDPVWKAEKALIGTKIPGYFPTPKAIVDDMVARAGIKPGMAVLEPSAGKGDIADGIRRAGVEPSVIEINHTLRGILEMKGHRIVGDDFLEHAPGEVYDAIVMNPPFEGGQDAKHIRHAYSLLKPGGRLVSVMSPGPWFRTDRASEEWREWAEEVGGKMEKLPDGSFLTSDRSTGVSTRLFVATKPARAESMEEVAADGASPEPKEGDTKSENGVTYILQGGRWHRQTPEEEDDDLDPSSPNYRYRDTGYIAGSRKEEAADMIRRFRRDGKRVRKADVGWEALEANPREAEELVTKSNLFGEVDWEALRDSGMEPGAGYLISKVYASLSDKPSQALPQARQDYALGLETLRDRLEACQTPQQVTAVLDEMLLEGTGAVLNASEQEETATLEALRRSLFEKHLKLTKERGELEAIQRAALGRKYSAEYAQQKRARRKWKPDPEMDRVADEANRELKEINDRLVAWDKDHPDIISQRIEVAGGSMYVSPLDGAIRLLTKRIDEIEEGAKRRNLTDNPMTRAWLQFGPKFLRVLGYRGHRGSESFRTHVASAKSGKIKDWSWLETGRTGGRKTSKESTRFQLKVADQIVRTGGREVDVGSTAALKARFGLRDVQSGNWVLRDPLSAKHHTESTAQAFADLADLLGTSDDAVSMHGRLAIAFGARGRGSIGWQDNAARAHYEPIHRVINLTKMGGGGSLAHEWFHALDNLLREALGEGESSSLWMATENHSEIRSEPVRKAFANLEKAMTEGTIRATRELAYTPQDYRIAQANLGSRDTPSPRQILALTRHPVAKPIRDAGSLELALQAIDDVHGIDHSAPKKDKSWLQSRNQKRNEKNAEVWRRAAIAWYGGNKDGGTVRVPYGPAMSRFEASAVAMDQGTRGKYYSSRREMAARAFQSWVEDRLAEQGRRSDYLSSYADNKHYEFERPYPAGEERARINEAFDRLVAVLRDGNLFHKAFLLMGRGMGRDGSIAA